MNPMLRAPKRVRPAHRVDLNTASQAELMKLPGITAELAAQIIAGRPYKSKIELMTRNILGYDRYDPIRHLIVAAPPR